LIFSRVFAKILRHIVSERGGDMKQIVNFIITGVILFLFARFFPASVQIENFKALFIATLFLFIAEAIVVIVIFIMMAASVLTGNLGGFIGGIVAIFFAEIIAISLVSAFIPGFTVIGFWAKFFIALALSIFRIPENNN
jgi:hypothetical protein